MESQRLYASALALEDEAERLREVARRADAAAAPIRELLADASGQLGPGVWEGTSATQAGAGLADARSRLGPADGDVDDACERLLVRASTLMRDAASARSAGDRAAAQELEEGAAAQTPAASVP